jgi:hypothetical protein
MSLFTVKGVPVVANLCPYAATISGFMAFLWVTTTWFMCAAMVKRTMDAN